MVLKREELSSKWWWRLAQILFALTSVTLLGVSVAIGVGVIVSSEYIDESLSTVTCDAGGTFNLEEFEQDLNIYSFDGPNDLGRYVSDTENAKAKVFCSSLAMYREGPTDLDNDGSTDEEKAVIMAEAIVGRNNWDIIKKISEGEFTDDGTDKGYTIYPEYDFTSAIEVGLYLTLALFIEVALLIGLRWVVLYTMLGPKSTSKV